MKQQTQCNYYNQLNSLHFISYSISWNQNLSVFAMNLLQMVSKRVIFFTLKVSPGLFHCARKTKICWQNVITCCKINTLNFLTMVCKLSTSLSCIKWYMCQCECSLGRGVFTCVGWQVTLCDPMRQVTLTNVVTVYLEKSSDSDHCSI